MAYSASCLKFLVLIFTVVFGVSGAAAVIFSVFHLVHIYSHSRFVTSDVSAPVLLLAFIGFAECLLAVLGWRGSMAGNTCRLYTFSVLLIAVILSEFGVATYALVSRAELLEDMTKDMEESFSKYAKDKDVADDWKSLQKELECCGVDGPNDYRALGIMDWSCCLEPTHREGACHAVNQRGCLLSLTHDLQRRLLELSLLAIATAIGQMTGVLCTCCLSNSLKNEKRRSTLRKITPLDLN